MIQWTGQLTLDVFWLAAMAAMACFSVVLVRTNLRPSAARWFGFLICAGCINILGVVLTDLVHEDHLPGLRAISMGRALIPFATLGFSLVFPYRRRLVRSPVAFLLLALPSMITIILTDPLFAPRHIQYQPQFIFLIVWMGGYFLWAYVNLFISFRRTRLRMTRRQHVLLSLASVPATAMHYTTSILLPAVGVDEVWRYNWVPIIAFGLATMALVRYGFISRRASMTRSLLDQSIDVAGLSSQIVAHAVKNSLQLIRSLAETAAGCEANERKVRLTRIVTLCGELAERMNRLGLLTRARIDLAQERFRVTEPLEGALERAAPLLEQVQIVREGVSPVPEVQSDRTHLEEVFLNLIANAVEAMPNGGQLRIEVKVENDWVLVGFHDQGVGIAPEQLGRVFEPFQTTKVPATNWGIGLSFCHLVVDQSGGHLFAESLPGKGSSFFVVLPQQF